MKLKNAFKEIKSNLPASIVVFIFAVPFYLGIALASGALLFAGFIGIVGGIVECVASCSILCVSGPAAGPCSYCTYGNGCVRIIISETSKH